MNLFLSPHNDDETLFGAFTIQREDPLVVVVYDSYIQYRRTNDYACGLTARRKETEAALKELETTQKPLFFGFMDSISPDEHPEFERVLTEKLASQFPGVRRVFAPALEEGGHPQHNMVARAAAAAFPGKVTHYLTYTPKGKSISANRVVIQDGEWIKRKLRALACYDSQIDIAALGCREHFMRGLDEYYQ